MNSMELYRVVKYGEIHQPEVEHSKYALRISNQDLLLQLFGRLMKKESYDSKLKQMSHLPYDYVLKCSHTFQF